MSALELTPREILNHVVNAHFDAAVSGNVDSAHVVIAGINALSTMYGIRDELR